MFGGGKYGRGRGGGIGAAVGSAGFGALAGTALGAYGGYKLGRMVGGLGREGHYGYYSDQGRYIRCDPPKTIKVDPETNVTYIPLTEDYDKRCSYFERQPPMYYTSSASHLSSPINQFIGSVLTMTVFTNFHQYTGMWMYLLVVVATMRSMFACY